MFWLRSTIGSEACRQRNCANTQNDTPRSGRPANEAGPGRIPPQCANTGSAPGTGCTAPRSSSAALTTAPTRKIPADHQNAVV